MFEDSTFESAGKIHTRSRRWGVAVFFLNSSILATLILIPLIYPDALPHHWVNILLVAPPPPPATPPPVQRTTQAFHGVREFTDLGLTMPTRIPTLIPKPGGVEGPPGNQTLSMDDGNGIPGGDPFGHSTRSTPAIVRAAPVGPQHISTGVANGMLIQRIAPRYPPIAVSARMQGTIVLQAIISKSGTIENLRVLSGPPMFQQAALDAVSQWRYRPYLLDGNPVEVETTINVVFTLNQ
ncbi:MAG TPA: energy transducer TonB [Terracidiphilus sp.]|nr:energy transducer TonB [Terracidiphilus sp.]